MRLVGVKIESEKNYATVSEAGEDQNKRSTAKDFNNRDIKQMLSELPKGLRTPLYKLLLDLHMTAEFLCILLLVFNHTLVAMLCLNLIWRTINPNIFFSFVFALDNYFFVAYSD